MTVCAGTIDSAESGDLALELPGLEPPADKVLNLSIIVLPDLPGSDLGASSIRADRIICPSIRCGDGVFREASILEAADLDRRLPKIASSVPVVPVEIFLGLPNGRGK